MKKALRRGLLYALPFLVCLLVLPLCFRTSRERGMKDDGLSGMPDTLRCVITLRDEPGKGLAAGFHYALYKKYLEESGQTASVLFSGPGPAWTDSLLGRSADILVSAAPDSLPPGLMMTRPFSDGTVWILRDDGIGQIRGINTWIAGLLPTDYYARQRRAFFRKEGDRSSLSPYDGMVRKYARKIHWDWRLLSSLIYHESRFSIDAASPKGAVGLMQVIPRHHDAEQLFDPENNIRTGTDYLQKLEKMFQPVSADETECLKFTLAAFNAGEGNVLKFIHYAAQQEADSTRWDAVVTAAREMDGFKKSTVAYVDTVLATYQAYSRLYKE